MIRRAFPILFFAAACRGASGTPAARQGESTPAVQPSTAAPAQTFVINHRPGAMRMDTARLMMAGPLVSTAGWTSFVVSYETNLGLEDSTALAAQADSVFSSVRGMIAQRPDTTTLMEAHFAPGRGEGGYRFLYHKLPDGSWARVP